MHTATPATRTVRTIEMDAAIGMRMLDCCPRAPRAPFVPCQTS